MVIADHNFREHVNFLINKCFGKGAGRGFRFQNDPSTEGTRCLVLPIVTPCRTVKNEFYVQLTVHRIVWQ